MIRGEVIAAASVELPGIDGFLGSRGSLGMDVVLVGLFALLPILAISIVAVRRKKYRLH